MITTKQPTDWKNLQDMVARILVQCGFDVQVEASVKTVRGQAEIDVYATEDIRGRKYTIACECKRWNTDIPQTIVHAFRTVVQDLGCNVGYIITTSDFQRGATENAVYTNIELLSWEQFQEKFIDTWFDKYFVSTITKQLDPLMTYCEPLLPKWYPEMTDQDKETYKNLKEIYDGIAYIVMSYFSTYSRTFVRGDSERVPLPIIEKVDPNHSLLQKTPPDIFTETGYLEFLDKLISFGTPGITAFWKLRDKYSNIKDDE